MKVNIKRLLKLADYLQTVPRENFSIGTWKCGTVACALGHACDIPDFKQLGFRLQPITFGDTIDFTICYNSKLAFKAAEDFFDIDCEDSLRLFSDFGYCKYHYKPTPKIVARHIYNYVNKVINKMNKDKLIKK